MASVGKPDSHRPNLSAAQDRASVQIQPSGALGQPINPDITLDNFLHLSPTQLHPNQDVKDPERNIRAIHLADSQLDEHNMYMQLYGVPETWLSLVSQITRLANLIDGLSSREEADAGVLVSLEPKAAHLEKAVCVFRRRHQGETDNSGSTAEVISPHVHMVHALSSALVVFFYRRIRKVNPLLLQDSVNSVISHLQSFDEALEKRGLRGPGTAWPAFVAGAEAISYRQRRSITTWLDKGFAKSGFAGYQVSREILEEVWEKTDDSEAAGDFTTWMDVCKQTNRWPLLC